MRLLTLAVAATLGLGAAEGRAAVVADLGPVSPGFNERIAFDFAGTFDATLGNPIELEWTFSLDQTPFTKVFTRAGSGIGNGIRPRDGFTNNDLLVIENTLSGDRVVSLFSNISVLEGRNIPQGDYTISFRGIGTGLARNDYDFGVVFRIATPTPAALPLAAVSLAALGWLGGTRRGR